MHEAPEILFIRPSKNGSTTSPRIATSFPLPRLRLPSLRALLSFQGGNIWNAVAVTSVLNVIWCHCLVGCQERKGTRGKSRATCQLSSPFPYESLHSRAQNKLINLCITSAGMYCFEIVFILVLVCSCCSSMFMSKWSIPTRVMVWYSPGIQPRGASPLRW